MRSLPLVLLTVGALLAPATALANGSATTPPSRFFVITGLVFGDTRIAASGKLSIEGGQLIASVGCNMIGGRVTLEGDTLTIPEPLAMTEMACLGVSGDTEAMLVKILQAGPFTIGARAWTANDAAILVEELPSGPGPGASAPPPDDGVVSNSPEPGTGGPAVSCPPIPIATNGTSTGEVPPDAGGGGGATGSGSAPAATAVDLPLATAGDIPPATPELGQTEPEPTVLEPGTPGSGIGTDPGIGKPVESDPCGERLTAIDQGFTGGAGGEPPKTTDAAAERATIADASAIVPVGIGLSITLVVGILAIRRVRAVRPPNAGDGGTTSLG